MGWEQKYEKEDQDCQASMMLSDGHATPVLDTRALWLAVSNLKKRNYMADTAKHSNYKLNLEYTISLCELTQAFRNSKNGPN